MTAETSASAVGRILVVENDPGTADLLRTDLSNAGYEVVVAEQADAALEIATSQSVEVVLIALDRPNLCGTDLLTRIKDRAPQVPVLMIGGPEAGPEAIAHAIDLGAADYVRAPFHPTILRTRITAAIDRRALRVGMESGVHRLQQLSRDLQEVILPLGVSLTAEKNVDRLLYQILLEAKKLCHADAGTLYVRTKDDRLQFSIMLTDSLGIALGGPTGKEIPFEALRLKDAAGNPNYRNVATHAALHGYSVNVKDIYGTEAFDFAATREFDRRNRYRSISVLTVPLKDNEDRVVAVLQLLNALDPVTGEVVPFDPYHQLVVESLASQAAIVFNNQLLLQRQAELLKFVRDLQIGRQIQQGFLPETLPEPAGYQIAARFRPAREVAGDFYDAFMLGPGSMGFVVADVCDKGVGAALFMALVRSLMRVYSQQRYTALVAAPPATGSAGGGEMPARLQITAPALQQAVVLTNDYIGENHLNMNMFATMFAGVLDLETGDVAYVNGGHNAPILRTAGGATVRLPSKSPAVGMVPGFQYSVKQTRLNPGDLLVVFSDGIPDARDPHNRFFTEARLLRIAEATMPSTPADRTASDVEEALIAHISTAAQFDDITLMVIRRDLPV